MKLEPVFRFLFRHDVERTEQMYRLHSVWIQSNVNDVCIRSGSRRTPLSADQINIDPLIVFAALMATMLTEGYDG